MYMRELLEAVMVDPEYRALDSRFRLMKGADLFDVCRSLVVHHEETDIITLSHMSVKVSPSPPPPSCTQLTGLLYRNTLSEN